MSTAEDIKEIKNNCIKTNKEFSARLSEGTKTFAVYGQRLVNLEDWQHKQNGTLVHIKDDLIDIRKDLVDMRSESTTELHNLRLEVAKGRPTWAVVTILTLLSSATVGLAVAFFTG